MVKKYGILALAVAALGGPVAWFHFFDHPKASPQATAAETRPGVGAANFALPAPPAGSPGGDFSANISATQPAGAAAPRRSSVRLLEAGKVFDFQITPEWVVAQWPAVTTGLARLQLEGYRVPLVTGTAQQDLAGSLTYYFNAEQKLQQITFMGTTGDPRPLIGLLANRFHLARRLVNDPGLVVYEAVRSDNRLASSLRIRLAPLADANGSYRRYDIDLSLERPEEQ